MKFRIFILSLMVSLTSINIHATDVGEDEISIFGYNSCIPDGGDIHACVDGVKEYMNGSVKAFKDTCWLVAPLMLICGYVVGAPKSVDHEVRSYEQSLTIGGDCGNGREEIVFKIADKLINNETVKIDDVKYLKPNTNLFGYHRHATKNQYRMVNYLNNELRTCFTFAADINYRRESNSNFEILKEFGLRNGLKIKKVCYLNGEPDEVIKVQGDINEFDNFADGKPKGAVFVYVGEGQKGKKKECHVMNRKRKKRD